MSAMPRSRSVAPSTELRMRTVSRRARQTRKRVAKERKVRVSALSRHLSFARAADELHVTPAALSHQIRGLEQEVGVALFHRRTRAIELTDAGKLIYPGIHAGFASLRNAVGQIARARDHNVLVI